MISNPNPEHGPLWVERNPAWPHDGPAAFLCWLGYRLWLDAEQADAIEAQITQLPDGVYRWMNSTLLQSTFFVPDGWERESSPDRASWTCPSVIRRTPAEPPAPPTVDVPLHELCGRKLPGCDWVVRSWSFGLGRYEACSLDNHTGQARMFTLNSDGTVTVQRETGE